MIIQSIEEQRELLLRSIDRLREDAYKHINEYWAVWKERNRVEIRIPRDSNVFKHTYLGSFAPKIAMIGDAKKFTIHWYQYKPYKNKAPNHMGMRVMPAKSGLYSQKCFKNHAVWEWELIERTESLLYPYRDLLEYYHELYIKLGRQLRKYSYKKVKS